MRDDPIDFDTLMAQFDKLGHRDRKAVLAQLTPDERDRIGAAMAAQTEARRKEAERARRAGRQFAGYSPWLAELLQQAGADKDRGNKGAVNLSDAAWRSVANIHRAIHNEDEAAPEGLLAQIRAWGKTLLSPQAGERR